jgi:hypothetical protein
VDNLLDDFRVDGGFDGEKIFVSLALDLSKEVVSGVGDLLDKPLQLLGGNDAGFLREVFGSDGNINNTGFDSGDTAANTAFSASAHLEVQVGFNVEGLDLATISSTNVTDLGERLYIQVKDASSKFSASLDNIDANIDIGGVSSLSVTDGYVACLIYFGLPSSTRQIPFRELSSVPTLIKQLQWQKGGIVDVSLPVGFEIDGIVQINPTLSIQDDNLFDSEFPVIALDVDISDLIDGDDFIEGILDKLTVGLGLISGESGEGFDVGGLGENIGGVLSDFGLNLTSLTADFKAFFR